MVNQIPPGTHSAEPWSSELRPTEKPAQLAGFKFCFQDTERLNPPWCYEEKENYDVLREVFWLLEKYVGPLLFTMKNTLTSVMNKQNKASGHLLLGGAWNADDDAW